MTIYAMRIERAKQKSIILAIIVETTRIVRGKYIFVINEDELTKELEAEIRELENSVHGRRATKRKTEYGILPAELVGIRIIMEKAKLITSI